MLTEFVFGPLDGLRPRNLAIDPSVGLPRYLFKNYGKPWQYLYQARVFAEDVPVGEPLKLYFVQMVQVTEAHG